MQTTAHLLMIRPVNFGFNEQTAVNNAFQVPGKDENAQVEAAEEFDTFVAVLRDNGVDVTVVSDTMEPNTPDSIFPNNWVSFHNDGTVILYPMYAINRRLERKPAVLAAISNRFEITRTIDLSHYESNHFFLEGTGSMVLDREKKIAYACLSPRTDKKILKDFCDQMGYSSEVFDAADKNGQAIYHTNVIMCVADHYVVICLDTISSVDQRNHVIQIIERSGKELVPISLEQVNHFAGNMLQVHNDRNEKLLVMSTQAFESLSPLQLQRFTSHNKIVHSPLTTIEANGGGSARCMMAEIHLPEKQ